MVHGLLKTDGSDFLVSEIVRVSLCFMEHSRLLKIRLILYRFIIRNHSSVLFPSTIRIQTRLLRIISASHSVLLEAVPVIGGFCSSVGH